MSKSTIKAYIQYIYRITPWQLKLIIASVLIYITIFISQVSKTTANSQFLADLILLGFGIGFVNVLSWIVVYTINHYRIFKKTIYSRTRLLEKVEEIKSAVSPDIWKCLKEMDDRIKDIEKNLSPLRISIYAIFVGVATAGALLIISPIILKIISLK